MSELEPIEKNENNAEDPNAKLQQAQFQVLINL
jgi:hypothetical protein